MFRRVAAVSYFRNFIFGVEDSLVSTVGLLSGVAVAGVERETIFLTGVVLIFVEAFSMAAGSFLAETSASGYANGREKGVGSNLAAGGVMFISYFISGFLPLFSYLIWPVETALVYSIIFAVGALFVLGLVSGKMTQTGLIRNAARMAIIGGMAIGLGVAVGWWLPILR